MSGRESSGDAGAAVSSVGPGAAVAAPAGRTVSTPAGNTRLIGRDREVAQLRAALGHPRAVALIEGEAGVGKSRLLEGMLSGQDDDVLFVVCPPFREPFTLGPLVDALRQRCPQVHGLPLSPLAGALRPLFPEWAPDLPSAPEPSIDAKADRHRLFTALLELLECLHIRLLVVEDVHWADEASLEFLLLAISRRAGNVRLVATYRPEDLPSESLLLRLSSRLPAKSVQVRVRLRPFDRPAAAELMSSILGGDPVCPTFVEFIHQQTEGLPLAVEESVRLLREQGHLVLDEQGWRQRAQTELAVPPMLRDAVLERVQPLGPQAQRMLRVAAVLGESADQSTLVAACDLPPEQAWIGLAEAQASGLLTEDRRGMVDYRHMLAARAVYESIPGPERRRFHQRVGEVLESRHPLPVPRLVYHFRNAGDLDRWLRYGEQAADLAVASGDDATGIGLLSELIRETPPGHPVRYRLAHKLAYSDTFRRTAFGDLVHLAVETLRAVLDAGGLTASEDACLRSPLGRFLMQTGALEEGRAHLEASIPELTPPSIEATRAMIWLGWPYGSSWPARRHRDWIRRAAASAPDVMSDIDRLTLDRLRMTTLLLLGEDSGWQLAASIPTVAGTAQEALQAALGHGNAGYAAMLWGRYDEARGHLCAASDLDGTWHFEGIREPLLGTCLHLDWYTGAWSGLADRAEALANADSDRLTQFEARLVAASLLGVCGTSDEAEAQLRNLLDEIQTYEIPELSAATAAAAARLALSAGRVEDALRVTEEPAAQVAAKGSWIWATEVLPVRVSALTGTGRLRQAATLVTNFAATVGDRNAPAAHAALAHSRAVLAQGAGDAAAVTSWCAAVRAWQELPRPYEAQLAKVRQAEALIESGREQDAVPLLSEAGDRLARLGATADLERVKRLLVRHGVGRTGGGRPYRRPHGSGRRAYGDSLSPREREVITLLVEGRTNREIAKALALSPKTVANHLDSARRKLNAASRTALAVKAIEAGLVEETRGG